MFKLNLSFLKKINRNSILVGVAIIAIIITGGLIYANSNNSFSLASIFGKSSDQIGKNVVDYINNNQLSQTPATLVSVSEASGLIKVKIKIGTNEFDSYATKDGKFLFPQAIDMVPQKTATDTTTKPAASTTDPTATASVQKSDKPMLEAFVVSSCPYGLQMQRAVADAVKSVPALVSDVKIRYIGSISNGQVSSMHDASSNGQEAQENLRQICLREEQPTKFWNYLSCYMSKASGALPNGMPLGDSKGCLASTGVDTVKVNTCMTDPAKGLAYAKVDFDLSAKYNVQGSPTLFLNGTGISESSYGGRSSDAVRAMVCAGSTTEASFCSTKLNTAGAAASFSATYSSASGSATSAANCAPAAN